MKTFTSRLKTTQTEPKKCTFGSDIAPNSLCTQAFHGDFFFYYFLHDLGVIFDAFWAELVGTILLEMFRDELIRTPLNGDFGHLWLYDSQNHAQLKDHSYTCIHLNMI